MATTVKKTKDLEISTDEGMICAPDWDAKIAGLAYCKAEKRGFELGHELDDWLEAEQECLLSEPKESTKAAAPGARVAA